jgi:hypothetical protein
MYAQEDVRAGFENLLNVRAKDKNPFKQLSVLEAPVA